MGAWGEKSFDNDHALDWLWELEEPRVEVQLVDLFTHVIKAPRGELSVSDGEEALAGAEVVAAAGGCPPVNLPKDCAQAAGWIKTLNIELIEKAAATVDRVEADSGLRDAWEDSGETRGWRDAVQELRERLLTIRA